MQRSINRSQGQRGDSQNRHWWRDGVARRPARSEFEVDRGSFLEQSQGTSRSDSRQDDERNNGYHHELPRREWRMSGTRDYHGFNNEIPERHHDNPQEDPRPDSRNSNGNLGRPRRERRTSSRSSRDNHEPEQRFGERENRRNFWRDTGDRQDLDNNRFNHYPAGNDWRNVNERYGGMESRNNDQETLHGYRRFNRRDYVERFIDREGIERLRAYRPRVDLLPVVDGIRGDVGRYSVPDDTEYYVTARSSENDASRNEDKKDRTSENGDSKKHVEKVPAWTLGKNFENTHVAELKGDELKAEQDRIEEMRDDINAFVKKNREAIEEIVRLAEEEAAAAALQQIRNWNPWR